MNLIDLMYNFQEQKPADAVAGRIFLEDFGVNHYLTTQLLRAYNYRRQCFQSVCSFLDEDEEVAASYEIKSNWTES